MSQIRASQEATQNHYKFVTDMWDGHGSRAMAKPALPGLEDITVAGLGLAGEAGEVADEIEKMLQGATDQTELIKELGDARYYWFKLVDIFQLNLTELLPATHEGEDKENDQAKDPTVAVGEFLSKTLKAVERIKKFVRDRTGNAEPVGKALSEVDRSFINLLRTINIPEETVFQSNQEKLIERYARDKKLKANLNM